MFQVGAEGRRVRHQQLHGHAPPLPPLVTTRLAQLGEPVHWTTTDPDHTHIPLHTIMCPRFLFGYLVSLLATFTACSGQEARTPAHDSTGHVLDGAHDTPVMKRTQGVASGNVRCELQDRDGHIWFSTHGEGIYRYDGRTFRNFTTADGLAHNKTSAIIQTRNGKILIGTHAGVCQFDGTSFSRFFEVDSLKELKITALLEDRDGHLWFATLTKGIFRYDGSTVTNFLGNKDGPYNLGSAHQLIQDLHQDARGNVWATSWNGGGVWRFTGGSFTNFLPPASYYTTHADGRGFADPATVQLTTVPTGPQDHITDDMIFSVAEDSKGNLWFATRRHGACRYDGTRFTTFGKPHGFTDYGVYAMAEDAQGNLWFGTEQDGVFRYDGTTFRKYTTADGLVNNSVFSILCDRAGHLWFGTRGFGLCRFDGERFTTFSE